MATVHLGRALGVGGFERFVAIKVMHAHLAEEPEFVAMFLDEGRLAARIRHPNVVGTIDIQQDEQGLFLVMDYVDGPSLQKVLRAVFKKHGGPPPLDVALRIFADALAGLHAAHELRGGDGEPLHLVHRDVSPQNILISVDGIAQITDFGVARAESRLQTTRAGVVKGKVCYMAPEQIRSEPIDRRTDIYAAGALLWELLTGQRLIRGDNDGAMMEQILRGHLPTPHEVTPTVPEALSAVAMRALAASPADRFPTAAELADALEAAAAREGVAIATPRVVSAFIKGLGFESADSGVLPSASKSLDVPAPVTRREQQPVSAATAAPAGHVPDSTHGGVLAPSADAGPRRTSSLRRAGAGAAALVVGGAVAWFLIVKGPLQLSWRGAPSPAAASVKETPKPEPTVEATPSSTAVPEPHSAPPATSSAVAATSATVAPVTAASSAALKPAVGPKGQHPKSDSNPASFRPKDL
jgi:serine/threonine-protein kinase